MANYYFEEIKINEDKLPRRIREEIALLKKYDKEEDDFNYNMEIDNFDPFVKSYIIAGMLPEIVYHVLMYKYCREYINEEGLQEVLKYSDEVEKGIIKEF